MRLLRRSKTGEICLTEDLVGDAATPAYAILSHTWGADAEEVTFDDLTSGTGKDKTGYEKIRFCGEQAALDNLEHFWIDTCCIDKANKAELSHAINSMFRWYQKAAKCYVYLSDVSVIKRKASDRDFGFTWMPAFRLSKWFTRGWTLQELLAPSTVEFFSCEGKLLDNKASLAEEIHEITGIPKSAIQGARLSQFTVDQRLSWIQHRQTKLEEDKTYSLLGILDVYIAPFYGEGTASAFQRLREEINKLDKCIQDVRLTDPRDDKNRIVDTKGGLLEGSYRWVLDHHNFKQWHSDPQSRLLWIKGDPGKGKTMLLCGITEELEKITSNNLSFFFCQGTDSHINNATAVLRGLLFLLVSQQPKLALHLRKKYDQAGRSLFEDANAWIAVSDIFKSIVLDPDLEMTYLVVDALDECTVDLAKLLDLVIYTSSSSNRIKWLLSSRNELHIEQKLKSVNTQARLGLELKQNAEQVVHAVDIYIDEKLSCIESLEDATLRNQVREVLRQKANGTFLWVALVIQELEKPESWDPLEVVEEAPSGLYQLYDRMVDRIQQLTKRNSDLCRFLLSTVSIAYRPLYLAELGSLCNLSGEVSKLIKQTKTIVAMCGSFLTIRDDQVYLIHQSAKDYLSDEARATVFHHQDEVHYEIFSRSLKLMSGILKRDVYSLGAPGCMIGKVTVPVPDPLATTRYSCVHWMDHLFDSATKRNKNCDKDLRDDGAVHVFLRERYLYWLEALSLCKSMPQGVVSIAIFEALIQTRVESSALKDLAKDAYRFIMTYKWVIENNPLQTYISALVFVPACSLMNHLFKEEKPRWITLKPFARDEWSTCLQTLEGHGGRVTSVTFSRDSTRLASASIDQTIKVWNAGTGICLQTLEGHSDWVTSVAFSHNSTWLASASYDNTVKIWDTNSGMCIKTLEGHSGWVTSVAFSHNSTWLASGSFDNTVKIWDTSSGMCLQTLKGHNLSIRSVAFSHELSQLVSASSDDTVKIWNTNNGACLRTLEGHRSGVESVAFSHDSTLLASASTDGTVKIWVVSSGECLLSLKGCSGAASVAFSDDSARLASATFKNIVIWNTSSGACLQQLEGHSRMIVSVVFSHDSTRLASASADKTIKIWDASDNARPQILESHNGVIDAVVLSHDLHRLASASSDNTVKIWDASSVTCLQTLKGHFGGITSVTFSHNSTWLASGSYDKTVKIWDTSSGVCLQTLQGHNATITSVAFSHDSTRLVSTSSDKMAKIWDTSSGVCLQTLEGHSAVVRSATFSHDSTRLASASYDDTVKIWDTSSGACLQTLKGHFNGVQSVAFSHNSTWLASGAFDTTVKIWDISSGACLQTLEVGFIVETISFDSAKSCIHTNFGTIDISTASITPSTNRMFRALQRIGLGLSSDKKWITHNSKKLLWLPSDYRPICSVVSGNTIVIGNASGRVWIYEVHPDLLNDL